jgi:hypothetical protein
VEEFSAYGVSNMIQIQEEECIWILVGNPEGKRRARRRRIIWEDNIKMDLEGKKIKWCGFD